MQTLNLLLTACKPDWGAWATFVGPVAAGLMALFAANCVAARQERILKKQIEIQDQMANLERHKIRMELLERRVEFLNSVDSAPDSFVLINFIPEAESEYEEKIRKIGILASSCKYIYGEDHNEYFNYVESVVRDYFNEKIQYDIKREDIDYRGNFMKRIAIVKDRTNKEIKPDTRVYSTL